MPRLPNRPPDYSGPPLYGGVGDRRSDVPVYRGTFGDPGNRLTYQQRINQGQMGYGGAGYDTWGSLPPPANFERTGPPIQPGDPLYFGGGGSPSVGGTNISGFGGDTTLGSDLNTSQGGQYLWGGRGAGPEIPGGGPSQGGTDIRDFGGNMSLGGNLPGLGMNTYDAGNGITYVYDQDWNYQYTQTAPTGTGGPTVETPADSFAGATAGGSGGSARPGQTGGSDWGVPGAPTGLGVTGGSSAPYGYDAWGNAYASPEADYRGGLTPVPGSVSIGEGFHGFDPGDSGSRYNIPMQRSTGPAVGDFARFITKPSDYQRMVAPGWRSFPPGQDPSTSVTTHAARTQVK